MYFGKNKDSPLVWKTQNDYKFAAMKEVAMAQIFAEKNGCHQKNKKVFFLDHSYCDLVKNQTN